MVKTVFLDRDGVINQQAAEHEYIKSCEEFQLLPGVAKAIWLLNQKNYKVLVVTNQRGIGRGMLTEQQLTQIHHKMRADLGQEGAVIDAIYYCPHDISDHCNCRKPQIGMFLQAARDFAIDKTNSFMVGDSRSDVEAATAFGIKPIYIGPVIAGIESAGNLLAAVENVILKS